MKVDILVPTSLSEITLEQYQKFEKVNTEENQNTNFLMHKMVEIFCNLDLKDVAKIRFNYVKSILNDLNGLFDTKDELIPTFTLKGIEYGFIPALDDMTLGEYIDLDENFSSWETMHKAMAVLYRPITMKSKDKYHPELFESGIAETNDYGAASNFGKKWGWYQSIYGIAKGDVTKYDDITKTNFHTCLLYLAFEKEKVELERKQIKTR